MARKEAVPCASADCAGRPPSAPEVALFINGAHDVKVTNCILRGFDFGVVVVNAKAPNAPSPQIELSSNVIRARVGVEIVGSDRILVRDNRIEYGNGVAGVGIVAWGDSDYNTFRDNVIVARDLDGSGNASQWPGSVPTMMRPDGIRAYSGTQARTATNVIVSGRLKQTISDGQTRQEGTVIEHNDVSSPGGYAICVADQSNTVVRENIVRRALQGLHVSGQMGMMRPPGRCSGNASRSCLEPRDCSLPGIDAETLGTCELPSPVYTFSTSTGLRFVSNHILGPLEQPNFDCKPDAECSGVRPAGIAVYPNAVSIVVEDNDVNGAQFAGIELILKSLESAIVRRNVVRDSAYALALISLPPGSDKVEYASHYGAIVSRNDFVGSRWRAVYVSPSFDFAPDLSDPTASEGNYWGHPCGSAFSPADASRPAITDSHPFGEPVARTPPTSIVPCSARVRRTP